MSFHEASSSHEASYDDGVVLTAEAEAVVHGDIDFVFSGLVGDVIEIAIGVGRIAIHGRGNDSVADCLDACDDADSASRGDEVSHHAFDRADGDFGCGVSEDLFDGAGFVAVIFACARAVGGDVMDIDGFEFGIGEGLLHGDDCARAVGVLVGDAECVGGGAVADDFGEWFSASRECMFECFEDDDAGAFAEDETSAMQVEGSAGFGRVFVGGGECGESVETGDSEGMDHGVRSAAEHDIGIATSEDFGGFADGLRAGGAGGEAVEAWPASAGESGEVGQCCVGFLFILANDVHQR